MTKFESLIKEAGSKGCWVDLGQRDQYWKAKQREWTWRLVFSQRSTAEPLKCGYQLNGALIIVVNSSIHPDTGEPVPLPFRMSAFVPTNLV